MLIKKLSVGAFQCNCTILACEKTREAIVVDPGDDAQRIIKILADNQLTLKYLVHTHAHLDHVGATKPVQEERGGEACLHQDDLFLFDNVPMQAALFGMQAAPTGRIDQFIDGGDKLKFGEHHLEVFHTPGHTPGSVSFFLPDAGGDQVFTGDTLFYGSIGRTDLWGGDYNLIIKSIRDKLLCLDENTVVHCGHGPETTIAHEKRFNPFVGQR